MRYLLQNAQILSSGGVFRAADVLLSGGRIVSIGDRISCPADAVSIDLHKAVLFPGFVDVHVHLREPGFSYKETIRTGTLAAAHGGFAHVAAMPNLDPVPDCAAALAVQRAIIEKDALVHVHPYGAISVGEKGERLADLDGLAPGVIAFSDDGRGVQEEAIAAKTVDTPVWFVRSKADTTNKAALKFYLNANQAVAKENGVYVSSRTGSAAEVWVTEKAQCPAAIWEKFSGQFKRFMALQLPGRVAKAEDFTRRGFDIHEEWVNGELRRWMVYVPSTYTGSKKVPLVEVGSGKTKCYACPIIKLEADHDNEDEVPALTIYRKRAVNVETERKPKMRTTEITADEFYVAVLSNEAKVVLAKFKA